MIFGRAAAHNRRREPPPELAFPLYWNRCNEQAKLAPPRKETPVSGEYISLARPVCGVPFPWPGLGVSMGVPVWPFYGRTDQKHRLLGVWPGVGGTSVGAFEH